MIKIKITGPQGEGKTTIAREIQKLLMVRLPYEKSIRKVYLDDFEVGNKKPPKGTNVFIIVRVEE